MQVIDSVNKKSMNLHFIKSADDISKVFTLQRYDFFNDYLNY